MERKGGEKEGGGGWKNKGPFSEGQEKRAGGAEEERDVDASFMVAGGPIFFCGSTPLADKSEAAFFPSSRPSPLPQSCCCFAKKKSCKGSFPQKEYELKKKTSARQVRRRAPTLRKFDFITYNLPTISYV